MIPDCCIWCFVDRSLRFILCPLNGLNFCKYSKEIMSSRSSRNISLSHCFMDGSHGLVRHALIGSDADKMTSYENIVAYAGSSLFWLQSDRKWFLHFGRSFIYANIKWVRIIWELLSATMLQQQKRGSTWWILFALKNPACLPYLLAYHTKRDPWIKKVAESPSRIGPGCLLVDVDLGFLQSLNKTILQEFVSLVCLKVFFRHRV